MQEKSKFIKCPVCGKNLVKDEGKPIQRYFFCDKCNEERLVIADCINPVFKEKDNLESK